MGPSIYGYISMFRILRISLFLRAADYGVASSGQHDYFFPLSLVLSFADAKDYYADSL